MPRFNEGRALLMWVNQCENGRLLSHEETAAIFLRELAEVVGMTPIAGPYSLAFRPPPSRPQDAGVSSVLVIEKSHLAIHTFPEQEGGAAQITIVSCKDFDPVLAKHFVTNQTLAGKTFSIDLGGSQGFFASEGH